MCVYMIISRSLLYPLSRQSRYWRCLAKINAAANHWLPGPRIKMAAVAVVADDALKEAVVDLRNQALAERKNRIATANANLTTATVKNTASAAKVTARSLARKNSFLQT